MTSKFVDVQLECAVIKCYRKRALIISDPDCSVLEIAEIHGWPMILPFARRVCLLLTARLISPDGPKSDAMAWGVSLGLNSLNCVRRNDILIDQVTNVLHDPFLASPVGSLG